MEIEVQVHRRTLLLPLSWSLQVEVELLKRNKVTISKYPEKTLDRTWMIITNPSRIVALNEDTTLDLGLGLRISFPR